MLMSNNTCTISVRLNSFTFVFVFDLGSSEQSKTMELALENGAVVFFVAFSSLCAFVYSGSSLDDASCNVGRENN